MRTLSTTMKCSDCHRERATEIAALQILEGDEISAAFNEIDPRDRELMNFAVGVAATVSFVAVIVIAIIASLL